MSSSKNVNEILKIKCDECPVEFTSVSEAIQHKFRKHRQSSVKYYCPYCGMQFPIKFCRDKHIVTHENEARGSSKHSCTQCEATFYNVTALQYHTKSTHNRIVKLLKTVETPPPSRKIKCNNAKEPLSVYYCHVCGLEYIMKFNLELHLEKQHTEEDRNALPEELIKCRMCDALFFSKKAYENHNLFHKSDDVYVENEEQRQALVTRVDQDFDIRRVQPQAEKFLPKVETLKLGRKRRAERTDDLLRLSLKQSRWRSALVVNEDSDSDCLSSASSVSDSEDEDKTTDKKKKEDVTRESNR